ncbi:MAG: hypothetical protein Q9M17_04900, partial [Mariprofundus sp.]|nr:hypothetical protein [Mariprofundus sp.]
LIGESLRVRVYERHLELFLGNDKTGELQRAFPCSGNKRGRKIDFRHVGLGRRAPQNGLYPMIVIKSPFGLTITSTAS